MAEVPGSMFTGVTFCCWIFCYHMENHVPISAIKSTALLLSELLLKVVPSPRAKGLIFSQ